MLRITYIPTILYTTTTSTSHRGGECRWARAAAARSPSLRRPARRLTSLSILRFGVDSMRSCPASLARRRRLHTHSLR